MARIPITPERQLRIVKATRLGLSGLDVAAYAYVPLPILDRWLATGEGATRGKARDLYLAVRQARADFRLGIQAGLLKAAKGGSIRAAEMLLEIGRDTDPRALAEGAVSDAADSVDFGILEGLSDAQMAAARLMVSGQRRTTKQIAFEVGVPPGTLSHWKSDPRFAGAVKNLRVQLHRITVHALVRGATAGAYAQEEALYCLRIELQRCQDIDEMVKITRSINSLATALQDRGGYPRTERTEIETVESSTLPRPHEETRDDQLRQRLRLLRDQTG